MSSWLFAFTVTLFIAWVTGLQDWSAYEFFTATALFAIFLKLKD